MGRFNARRGTPIADINPGASHRTQHNFTKSNAHFKYAAIHIQSSKLIRGNNQGERVTSFRAEAVLSRMGVPDSEGNGENLITRNQNYCNRSSEGAETFGNSLYEIKFTPCCPNLLAQTRARKEAHT